MLEIVYLDPISPRGGKTPVRDPPGMARFRMIDVADVHVLSTPWMERIREYLKISRGRIGMGRER
jgi:hypothetical protein